MILMDNFSLKFDKHNIFPCSELLCFIQVYYIGTSCLVSMLCPFSKLLSAWNKLSLDLSWPQAVRHEAEQDFLPFRLWRWTVLFQMMQHVPLIFILYINIILSFCSSWLQSKAKCNKVNICYVMIELGGMTKNLYHGIFLNYTGFTVYDGIYFFHAWPGVNHTFNLLRKNCSRLT